MYRLPEWALHQQNTLTGAGDEGTNFERNANILVLSLNCKYLVPSAFDDVDQYGEESDHLFAHTSWFDRGVVGHEEHYHILNIT